MPRLLAAAAAVGSAFAAVLVVVLSFALSSEASTVSADSFQTLYKK